MARVVSVERAPRPLAPAVPAGRRLLQGCPTLRSAAQGAAELKAVAESVVPAEQVAQRLLTVVLPLVVPVAPVVPVVAVLVAVSVELAVLVGPAWVWELPKVGRKGLAAGRGVPVARRKTRQRRRSAVRAGPVAAVVRVAGARTPRPRWVTVAQGALGVLAAREERAATVT